MKKQAITGEILQKERYKKPIEFDGYGGCFLFRKLIWIPFASNLIKKKKGDLIGGNHKVLASVKHGTTLFLGFKTK